MTRFLVFFGVALSLLGGIHYYIWLRLVRDAALPQPYRLIATVTIVVLGLSIPLTLFLRRGIGEQDLTDMLMWPAMVWLGLVFFVFFIALGIDLTRLAVWGVGKLAGGGPVDPERRLFIARLVAGVIGGLGLAATGFGLRSALGRVRVKTVEVALRRLPRELEGTVLAYISDVHIGQVALGREWMAQVVADINAIKPDLVAIGGDLVDASVAEIADAVAPLKDLRSRHGTFFVTGNHEYYAGATSWCAHLETLGVRVLRNERVTIGDGAASFDLAGVDDYSSLGAAPGHGPDLERELVLLAHQPRAIFEAAKHGVGLQISGHTHGGQLWPWRYFVYLQQPFVAGLGHFDGTKIYVSNGTGFWGPPMRLFAPPEITRVVLKRAVI